MVEGLSCAEMDKMSWLLFFGSAFVGDIKLHYKARHRGPCVTASRYQFIRTLLLEGSGLWFSLSTVR